jgi:hypothetical protein
MHYGVILLIEYVRRKYATGRHVALILTFEESPMGIYM